MKRLKKGLAAVAVALVMGSLVAGCGHSGAVKAAISSLAPSRTATFAPPTTAEPPTTEAPTTEVPTTEVPTTEAPATAPAQAASTAAASESGSSLLWLWIVLGAVIVIGVIAWIVHASSRRSAAAAGRRATMIDAYAKGQALADGLRIADAPGARAAGDAGARWADLQARADDLTQELYSLRESAPGEEDRARAAEALGSLQALRSAMAAEYPAGRPGEYPAGRPGEYPAGRPGEYPAGGAGEPQGARDARLRSRLLSFEAAIRALRPPDDRLPRI